MRILVNSNNVFCNQHDIVCPNKANGKVGGFVKIDENKLSNFQAQGPLDHTFDMTACISISGQEAS